MSTSELYSTAFGSSARPSALRKGDLPSSARWLRPPEFAVDRNGPVGRPFTRFDSDLLDCAIIRLFETAACRRPDAIAIDDGDTRLTYRAAADMVRDLAARIAAETCAGDLVGILLPTSTAFPIAMLACFAAGRIFVPLDSHYPQRWIADVIEQSGMTAVVGWFDRQEIAALIPAHVRRIDMTDVHEGCRRPAPPSELTPLGPDEPAMVLYTSGSTGRPKGIVNSQRNLLRRVEQHANAGHLGTDDRFLPLSSGCTIAGIRERLTALLCGATLHLVDPQRAGARQILTVLREAGITVTYVVPALLRSLIQLGDQAAPETLRIVRLGGDTVFCSDIDMVRRWVSPDCLIQLGFSSTEAPIMQWFVPEDYPANGGVVPIGYPLDGNTLAIVGAEGLPVREGEVGELVVRSPYVALGRWIDGACNGEDFPADVDDAACRIHRTGDLVRLRSDGLIDLVGRKDRQVKVRGQRVEPGQIEGALRDRPDVLDAAVLPRRSDRGTSLIAYVVPREPAPDHLVEALKQSLRELLPSQLQPQRIYLVPAIPRLASAKLDIDALQDLDGEHQEQERARKIAERDDGTARLTVESSGLEQIVAAAWRRALSVETVGRDQDYFDLGGNSLTTLNLMLELETALGVELPVTIIYQCSTVASLAQAIANRIEPKFSPLVLIKGGAGAPPFFLVHGIGGNVMELFPVGRHIDYPGPVYAIQARGLDGRSPPNRTIAEMAEFYLAAIRDIQPVGPYRLGGYSYGGLIAFEMASRLTPAGVAVLALLDSTTNPRQWSLDAWLDLWIRRWRVHLGEFRRLSPADRISHAGRIAVSLTRHVMWRLGWKGVERSSLYVPGLPPALQEVRNAAIEAAATYRPPHYAGTVTLFKSELGHPMMCDPMTIWTRCARAVELHLVPGDHDTMTNGENAIELARRISLCLAASAAAAADPPAAARERPGGLTKPASQAPYPARQL